MHQKTLDHLYRTESRRILATLIRLLGDFDLAEEALQDAFAAALSDPPVDPLSRLVAVRCASVRHADAREHPAVEPSVPCQ